MEDLKWLMERRLLSVERQPYHWIFNFDGNASLVLHGLWRHIADGQIRRTSEDDGHQFGLPEPVDAAAELNQSLSGLDVRSIALRDGTLDISISFANGHVLESVSTSSGYEAWEAFDGIRQFIGVGGGRIDVYSCSLRTTKQVVWADPYSAKPTDE